MMTMGCADTTVAAAKSTQEEIQHFIPDRSRNGIVCFYFDLRTAFALTNSTLSGDFGGTRQRQHRAFGQPRPSTRTTITPSPHYGHFPAGLAENLEQCSSWRSFLHEVDEYEVKHHMYCFSTTYSC